MEQVFTDLTISISEFKNNPQAALRKSLGQPFAVLVNNRPAFYVLTPEKYDQLLETAWEHDMEPTLRSRLQNSSNAVKVDIKDL